MKKYILFSFLFLLVAFPVVAKSVNSNSAAQGQNKVVATITPVQNTTVTPTGNLVKNQGQEKKLQVSNQEVEDSVAKVSTQVQELIDTVGAKSGIGQQVKEIAQNQEKNQEKIKSAYYELKNRGQLVRLFVGSDKKITQALELMTAENKLIIEKLVALKNQTINEVDKTQLQDTIGILLTQNTYLEEKVAKENQANGLLGWFTRLFNRE